MYQFSARIPPILAEPENVHVIKLKSAKETTKWVNFLCDHYDHNDHLKRSNVDELVPPPEDKPAGHVAYEEHFKLSLCQKIDTFNKIRFIKLIYLF